MTATATNLTSLHFLQPGDKFAYQGVDYVYVQPRRTKGLVRRVHDGKDFVLSLGASVMHVGNDTDVLSAALSERQGSRAQLTLSPGDKVRFVDNDRTRRRGIAGVETVIVKVNQKTYGLANGWNVSPEYIEAVA